MSGGKGGRRRPWIWALAITLALTVALPAVGLACYRYGAWPRLALARAREASPHQAARLYALIARRYPVLEPYAALWTAERALPGAEAVRTLHDLAQYLPDGPVASGAHVALARYYARIESPETVNEYQAALTVDDRADIRLELARYLEEQASPSGAYGQYLRLLGDGRDDALPGARRTAPGPVALAQELLNRGYLHDVLDVLYGADECQASCLRAEAYRGLGQDDDAGAMDATCAACTPPQVEGDAAPSSAPSSETPLDLWNQSWELEDAADYAALVPLYLRLAALDSVYADDAAYRALMLARRLDDGSSAERAERLLAARQPNWLAYRATGELPLCLRADRPAEAVEVLAAPVMARVEALEALGLAEVAHQELRLAALNSETPEVLQRMAQELLARGYTTEAWSLARAYLQREPCAPRAMWELAYPRPYADDVLREAEAYRVEPALLWAMMLEESAYQPEIVSRAGARGLMQIMPATQGECCADGRVPCAPGASFAPAPNIHMGAWALREYLSHYGEEMGPAVMAYNAGPGNVDEWLQDPNIHDRDDLLRMAWFGETREYLERVMLGRLVYQALYGDAVAAPAP